MKQLLLNMRDFILSLSVGDIVFFVASLSLIILAVIVVYLLRAANEESQIIEEVEKLDNIHQISNEELLGLTSETLDDEDILPPAEDEPDELIDLAKLTEILTNQQYQEDASIDAYEKSQEERAIISYDELIENSKSVKINYAEELVDDGISIKKVDLNNLTSEDPILEARTTKVQLYSYDKEEAFLKALKDLQKMLS